VCFRGESELNGDDITLVSAIRIRPNGTDSSTILMNSHGITREIATLLMHIPCFSVCFRGESLEVNRGDITQASAIRIRHNGTWLIKIPCASVANRRSLGTPPGIVYSRFYDLFERLIAEKLLSRLGAPLVEQERINPRLCKYPDWIALTIAVAPV
jgi:hypothetical protein